MSEQMDIFAEPDPLDYGPKARESDPQTSHAAAEKILATRAGSQRWLLWEAFTLAMDGLTDEEACRDAGVSLRSEYATRCSELRNAGVITVTGTQRAGDSGLMRDVSRITYLGISEWRKRNAS